ncbi:hypothetical protein BJX64DRAFT_128649 [Aspergillus heterothallicus]
MAEIVLLTSPAILFPFCYLCRYLPIDLPFSPWGSDPCILLTLIILCISSQPVFPLVLILEIACLARLESVTLGEILPSLDSCACRFASILGFLMFLFLVLHLVLSDL